jgi:hypothetical protein
MQYNKEEVIVNVNGIIPYYDNAQPHNFNNMELGNIEIIIINRLSKDNVIHKNTMNNFPVTLKNIFISEIFNCDLESSFGYRHRLKTITQFKNSLEEIGIKFPFGCKVFIYETMKYENEKVIFGGCVDLCL